MTKAVTLDDVRAWPATTDLRSACEALGISKSHGYALAARGEFPCRVIHVGTRVRVVTESLLELLLGDAA